MRPSFIPFRFTLRLRALIPHHSSPNRALVSLLALFFLITLPPAATALEPGSSAPDFQLNNLAGATVSLVASSENNIRILYFFDVEDESLATLHVFFETTSENADIVSLCAVSRENPEKLNTLLADNKALETLLLHDDRGITFAYGLTRKLPAAVIIAPGGIVGGIIAPVPDAGDVLMATAEAFLTIGQPLSARRLYFAMPRKRIAGAQIKLGIAYASILAGDDAGALRTLKSLADETPSMSSEVHAASAFLAFLRGENSNALGTCRQAPNSGFARYLEGAVKAATDRCDESAALFEKATHGPFIFEWQEALAFNMAAKTAETNNDDERALGLYKRAFSLAPLNPVIEANLLAYHWGRNNIPAATAYAETIDSAEPENPLINVLLNEFAADVAFSKDKAAQSRLERMLVAHPKRRRGTGNARDGTPHTVLVSDIAVMSCAPHMNFLPVGCAAVVKRNLESAAGIVTVKRAESSFVRKRLGFSEIAYKDPVRMAQVARKLEADFLVFGEMGNYKGEYILNLRLADVFSGEVIAITAERFSTLGDLIPALERSAQQLVRNLAVHRDGQ